MTDEGLTRYVRDFYSYRVGPDGRPESPLGSHVNAHTAGGLVEGGYLGFAELQYVHMPLPGERLVAFLSDGAFEEQRGSDWAPRWWRAEDSRPGGAHHDQNGRRIDQRTTMSQQGGVAWLARHLRLNGFDPIVFDGRDPAAFAWAIFEIERRLERRREAIGAGRRRYPVPLPYGIAVAPKGAGFPGAGTNLAHNLPLAANPRTEPRRAPALQPRRAGALGAARGARARRAAELQQHRDSGRPRERDHPLAHRDVRAAARAGRPSARCRPTARTARLDDGLADGGRRRQLRRDRARQPPPAAARRQPGRDALEPAPQTLELLKFRVTEPEPGMPESIDGAVITALNEEAVACAALANKGGINLVVTYEAFGAKMHGAFRQEIVFARPRAEAGRPPRLAVHPAGPHLPHVGEREERAVAPGPGMGEAMLGELSPRVAGALPGGFQHGGGGDGGGLPHPRPDLDVVVPKGAAIPDLFTADEARGCCARAAPG